MKIFLLFWVGILFTFFIKNCPILFGWLGAIWSILFFICFKTVKKKIWRILSINASIFLLIFSSIEFYLAKPFAEKIHADGNMWSQEYYLKHPILGYSPPPNVQKAYGKKYYSGQIIYDMQYQTDENGLRVGYPKKNMNSNAILFFGCSVIFGDGLNNDQTLSWQVGKILNESFNTYNFGYSGYGPHQMLAALENNLVSKIVKEKPKYLILTTFPGHIVRSSGNRIWLVASHDPYYEINNKEELYFSGHFDDNEIKPSVKTRLYAILSNSFILKKLYSPFMYGQKRNQNENDLNRYIKIILKARDFFEAQNPGSEFHILFWPFKDPFNDEAIIQKILLAFKKNNIRVHMVSEILPGFYQNNPHYQIPFDMHPTAYTNVILSKYIEKNIVKRNTK